MWLSSGKRKRCLVKNGVECILHSIAQDSSSKVNKANRVPKIKTYKLGAKLEYFWRKKKISKINSAGALFYLNIL